MRINDVLNILYKHQEECILIAYNLMYDKEEFNVEDIIQEMYLSIAQQIKKNQLQIEEIIVNDKPHFGIVKKTIEQIIQLEANIKNKYAKDENFEIANIKSNRSESIKYLEEDINNLINEFYWFDRKLFKLYIKRFNSVRSLAKETKLGHVTVFEVINKCKKKIKKRLYEK